MRSGQEYMPHLHTRKGPEARSCGAIGVEWRVVVVSHVLTHFELEECIRGNKSQKRDVDHLHVELKSKQTTTLLHQGQLDLEQH